MLDQLLTWDTRLFLWLNQMGHPTFDFIWLLLSEKATNVLVYCTLLFFYGRKMGLKPAVIAFFLAVILVGLTDQITNLFKDGFMRLRPCYTPEIEGVVRLVKDSCGGKYSFFSGHSSNSFALATFFVFLFKRIKALTPLLFSLAAFIAYSRIYLGVHFPLDIICGACVGIFNGACVYSLVNKRMRNLVPNF